MEDFKIDIMIESGPNARTVQLNLNPPLSWTSYSSCELVLVFLLDYNIYRGTIDYKRSASILKMPISMEAAIEIAGRSRGTPRIANALLRRVRDFAQKGKWNNRY
jgi:Holliday junction DNA helicase RuvB